MSLIARFPFPVITDCAMVLFPHSTNSYHANSVHQGRVAKMGAAFEFVQFVLFLRIKTRGNPIIKKWKNERLAVVCAREE